MEYREYKYWQLYYWSQDAEAKRANKRAAAT
jgi:hypothetical protein